MTPVALSSCKTLRDRADGVWPVQVFGSDVQTDKKGVGEPKLIHSGFESFGTKMLSKMMYYNVLSISD